jgi:hypothetical protein
MGRIESAREAVLQWSRSVLALRGRSLDGPPPNGTMSADEVDAVFGETGLVMTPAQTAGFFARSSSWRCTGCGKVHVFAHVVPVVAASPCVCASIEFEPRVEVDFSWGTTQRPVQLVVT